jgi:glutamate decarboxylase
MTGIGTATTGSSEAIHLGGLAMKRRWEERRRKEGKSTDKPNIIMGANAQVALEKFARYFDVEARILPVYEDAQHSFSMQDLKKNLDENTIGVFAIMGSTYTGHFQDVKEIEKVLDEFESETGNDVPIHVDGASGAFVAPFLYPDLEWDFRVKRVNSINTSGHKFGLTTSGCGWIIWKDRQFLPQELLFELAYLGGSEETFTLNFSRPGFPIVLQYYNLIKLGFNGYARRHSGSLANARLLSIFLEATGWYECVSDIHRPKGQRAYDPNYHKIAQKKDITHGNPLDFNPGLPVVAFKFNEEFKKEYPNIPQQAIAMLLRAHGYIIPNYPMPPAEDKVEVLRVVCRASMTVDFMEKLMEDIVRVTKHLIDGVQGAKLSAYDSKLIYTALQTAMSADSDETEHKQNWKFHKKSGTRGKHHAKC